MSTVRRRRRDPAVRPWDSHRSGTDTPARLADLDCTPEPPCTASSYDSRPDAAHGSLRGSSDVGPSDIGIGWIAAGHSLRRARDAEGPRADARRRSSRWRSASAPTPRSSRSSTRCCCGRCPIPSPERLVIVWQDLRARGGPATEWTGPSQQFDWKAQTDVFESLTSIRGWNASLAGGDDARIAQRRADDLRLLRRGRHAAGARPRVPPTPTTCPNAPRVVVLSHGLWMRRFGGDRGVIGRVDLDQRREPRSHRRHAGRVHAGLHARRGDVAAAAADAATTRRATSAVFHTFGRLRAGVTIDQARARLDRARETAPAGASGVRRRQRASTRCRCRSSASAACSRRCSCCRARSASCC